ncbi:helix-turn-helix transcriptional regulator [Mycoplasma sp. ATU-Cv-703]|uniref:helix-turn-helix domain-containing protein n=1 Tax=Mycoplasma sp. ATU-Cv-703 TaxID=2498595 RepID=UPI000FDEF892
MEFGDKLKQARLQMIISQEDIAKELGVTFATLNKLENKRRKPNYETQRAFAALCEKKGIAIKEEEWTITKILFSR